MQWTWTNWKRNFRIGSTNAGTYTVVHGSTSELKLAGGRALEHTIAGDPSDSRSSLAVGNKSDPAKNDAFLQWEAINLYRKNDYRVSPKSVFRTEITLEKWLTTNWLAPCSPVRHSAYLRFLPICKWELYNPVTVSELKYNFFRIKY